LARSLGLDGLAQVGRAPTRTQGGIHAVLVVPIIMMIDRVSSAMVPEVVQDDKAVVARQAASRSTAANGWLAFSASSRAACLRQRWPLRPPEAPARQRLPDGPAGSGRCPRRPRPDGRPPAARRPPRHSGASSAEGTKCAVKMERAALADGALDPDASPRRPTSCKEMASPGRCRRTFWSSSCRLGEGIEYDPLLVLGNADAVSAMENFRHDVAVRQVARAPTLTTTPRLSR